jgi:hypothetical protein
LTSKYPNSGILKRNPSRTSDKHPHYKGGAEVNGTEYWLSGWIKTKDDGTSFMSLSFEPKDKAQQPAPAKQVSLAEELNDDIPF